MEAFLRGLWLYHSATDKQIERFLEGKDPPRVNEMIEDLDKVWSLRESRGDSVLLGCIRFRFIRLRSFKSVRQAVGGNT